MRACLLLVASLAALAAADTIYLTVLYCPTLFSSKGATVSVDPSTGNWSVVGTFDWGKELGPGCLIEEDPTVYFDTPNSKLYLDFLDDFDRVLVLDVTTAQLVGNIPSKDAFFTGFENMALQSTNLVGVSGTVTQNGWCNDGCFQYGAFAISDGRYKSYANIPFKAAMDDSHFLDITDDIFYIQASYDLRAKTCGPTQASECLLAINASNGDLLDATFTNYTIYKYAQAIRSDGTILSFVEGFDSVCKHPYDDYAFSLVDLTTAAATLVACIPKDVVIDMDEWIATFSSDDSMLATGSGDAEGDFPQLLVFNTANGGLLLNSSLSGLATSLGAAKGLFDIWSVLGTLAECSMAEAPYLRHFTLMANYHLWAYERLYATVDLLSEEQYRKDVGLFFKSVHGTLNHLLVADRLWFGRQTQNFAPFNGLNEELYKDRAELKAAIFLQARKCALLIDSF